MEADRLETNLGPTADQDLVPEPEASVKQPKRRFVGRKTADQLSQKSGDAISNDVESSTAIQGVKYPLKQGENTS
jgi:2-(3-amino-3-carboxypropyl)histidine synthase